ncbi:hypothetical protein VTN77DRAFT_4374 [Rasamsonia byssochlamydoides]|uniref:uncharacterized protein n=1 Tax=Rasamsonia byssochlamydoides TaxID=89139 RepID=UPI0037430BEE
MDRTGIPSVKDHITFRGTCQSQQQNVFDGKRQVAVVRKLVLLVIVTAGFLLSPLACFPLSAGEGGGGEVESFDPGSHEKDQFQWSRISPSKELQYHDCFDGLQCGRLQVPMDHKRTDGKGRTFAIALARLPARVPVTDPRYGGAILINPGGPGGSGVAQLLQSGRNLQTIADSEVDPEETFDEKSKYFDIIGFDPRGVNNTTPRFSCFPDMFSRRNWELQQEADGMLGSSEDSLMRNWQRNRALAEGCSEQISAKIDGQEALGEHMNTSPVVEDMIEIVERHAEWREKQGIAQQRAHGAEKGFDQDQSLALRTRWDRGNEKLLYWGRSYGTVLGATFAAMHPDRVERAVLDGVVDLDSYYLTTGPSSVVDADAIFDRFAIYCDAAGSDGCGLYNPGGPDSIKASLRDLLSRIRNSSVPVPASATRGPEVVSWTDVMTLVRIAMYQPLYVFPLLAELLSDLRKGNGAAMADFKQRNREPSCLSSECLLAGPYSRECHVPGENDEYATAAILCTDAENLGKIDQDEFKQYWDELKAGSEMLGDYWAHVRLSCVGWKTKAKWRFTGPFTGNTSHPLLFVSNTLDPVTPLRSAHKMSSNFPGSVVLQQDSEGHTTLAAPSLCVAKAIRAYFQTGELPQPGMICQADMKPLLGAPSSLEVNNLSAADRILYAAIEDEVRNYRKLGRFTPL